MHDDFAASIRRHCIYLKPTTLYLEFLKKKKVLDKSNKAPAAAAVQWKYKLLIFRLIHANRCAPVNGSGSVRERSSLVSVCFPSGLVIFIFRSSGLQSLQLSINELSWPRSKRRGSLHALRSYRAAYLPNGASDCEVELRHSNESPLSLV